MTLDEARERVGEKRAWARGRDLVIPGSSPWCWTDLRRIASALGTEQIDLLDREPYDTIPIFEPIQERYEYEGGGCETCGYGSVVVVLGVIDEPTAP